MAGLGLVEGEGAIGLARELELCLAVAEAAGHPVWGPVYKKLQP